MFCKQLTSYSVDKKQVLWFDKKNEHELAHWCDAAKRQACINNLFNWLEFGRLHPFGETKNWLQTNIKRFVENDALDYFTKDIPKGYEFLKQWSHVNSPKTYVKQHKHVDFIHRNVIDHPLLIMENGLKFFCNGKVFLEMMMEIKK